MPLTRVSLRKGKSAEYKRAISDSIYDAMRETFNCPEDDQFILISEHEDSDFIYSKDYLNIARTDNLVIIQITCNNTRTSDTKKAFYKRLVVRLSAAVEMRPEDVFVSLIEAAKENWSLGNGDAQYAQ